MKSLKKFTFIILVLSFNLNAQSFKVKGTVLSPSGSVRYASVTFVDNNDTSKKYSTFTDTSGNYQLNIVTSINPNNNNLPTKFELDQNYPNPFSTTTEIPYKLKTQSDVQVTIYDILGRVVRKFSVGSQTIGLHSVIWDGRNNFGQIAATGIYFYRLQAGGESSVKKMVFEEGKSNFSAPMSNIVPSNALENRKTTNVFLQEGNYTVQIDNSVNTFPIIIPQQYSNINIQSDTTLNFSVNIPNQAIVYLDSTQQIIRGFGAANIIPWRPDMTTAEVKTAFGNGPGQLGFSILRIRVPYTDSISDFSANVSTAKLADSLGAIVFATPWTPPPALKSNNNIVGGTLNDTSYALYAAHLKSFADYMASQGAPLYAISIQNEPDANVNYESCYWDATQFLNFCKNNAASIGTRIMMPESESFVHALSDSTLNDSAAAANVAIIGGHIYGGGLAPYPLAISKGKDLWMTEHLVLDTTWAGNIGTGLEINNCMNAGMNAYVWWYIIRYYGPINENGNITKRGYVMSQYSKFIRPGFYKIKCNSTPQRNLFVTAYKDPSSSKVVIVALNTGSSQIYQTFSITNGMMNSFSQYTTSANMNCVQGNNLTAANGSFTAVLEPSSITTFISN
jgi:glucuronoarabinoxylan endo-1,4-beta-xylanase